MEEGDAADARRLRTEADRLHEGLAPLRREVEQLTQGLRSLQAAEAAERETLGQEYSDRARAMIHRKTEELAPLLAEVEERKAEIRAIDEEWAASGSRPRREPRPFADT